MPEMNPRNTYKSFAEEDTIYEREGILTELWNESTDEPPLNGGKKQKSRCGRLWLTPILYTHFWISAACLLPVPFYPPLASSRGLEPWKFGFVFSATKLGMLMGSVLSERVSHASSPRVGYLTGQLGVIVSCLLTTVLYWIRDADVLLGCSIVVSLAWSTTMTLYFSSIYAVLASTYEDRAGLLIASMEFLFGVASLVGLWLGGALIDAWAFPLPFFFMSAFTALSLPFMFAIKPKWKPQSSPDGNHFADAVLEEERAEDIPIKYWRLILSPVFVIDMLTGALPIAMMAFNEDTLEPYLRQFHLSSTELGTVFTVQSLGYSFGAIVSGFFSLYKLDSCIMLLGTALCAIAFLVVGPASFIEIGPDLNLVYLAMILMGFGNAPQFICGYIHGQRTAIRIGYPDDIRTTSVVSSAFFATLCLGSVGTAPLAGYAVSVYGYRRSTVAVFGALLCWVIVLCTLCAADWKAGTRIKNGRKYQTI
ncbi:uncharacterized protein LOC135388092 [Ornithodoros turicata]|uniref:uncharacterized protein LOC135388092 n=1 Tax=Ornithodoros turicata TaxID=34597 RepID=UPI003138A3FC